MSSLLIVLKIQKIEKKKKGEHDNNPRLILVEGSRVRAGNPGDRRDMKEMTVKEARDALYESELEALLTDDNLIKESVKACEEVRHQNILVT